MSFTTNMYDNVNIPPPPPPRPNKEIKYYTPEDILYALEIILKDESVFERVNKKELKEIATINKIKVGNLDLIEAIAQGIVDKVHAMLNHEDDESKVMRDFYKAVGELHLIYK